MNREGGTWEKPAVRRRSDTGLIGWNGSTSPWQGSISGRRRTDRAVRQSRLSTFNEVGNRRKRELVWVPLAAWTRRESHGGGSVAGG
jgi:hypothetical protein